MDADLEDQSGPDSDRGFVNSVDAGVSYGTLILKIGEKGKEDDGSQVEGAGNELREESYVIVVEGAGGSGDTEVLDTSAGEVEVVDISDVVDKKLSGGMDDVSIEEVDVDIDDSGNLQAVVLKRCDDVGNKEDAASSVKKGKEDDIVVDNVGSSPRGEHSVNVGMMDSDGAVGEPISVTSDAPPHTGEEAVGSLVGESEDEEVDIGGHEPNLFSNPSTYSDENIRSEPAENLCQSSYTLPAGKEGAFSVSDMLWGKVRSHPWWPGQIFDPSKASEIAIKHHKKDKDCYLVAFFGDRTFAWSEASQLRHFHAHFPHVEKQSNSESLHHAINSALEEVSRRVELGLTCQCIQTDVYEMLKYQNVENAGIQEEASRIESTDESASAQLFEPRNFLQYLKSIAQDPSSGDGQLEIVIAKAQLLAFNRLKGYYHLPEYQFNELSLNGNSETVTESSYAEEGHNQSDSSLKKKRITRDIVYTSKRERNMDESIPLMDEDFRDDETYNSSSASLLSSKKQNIGAPKQSFKIGDCIVRAASQLTGSPGPSSFLKSINEKYQKANESNGASRDGIFEHENHNAYEPTPVADDMLSQPQSMAHDPTKELSTSINLSPDKVGDGQTVKAPKSVQAPEAFEFVDMKDSYWTDRVVQNGGEAKTERKLNYQIVSLQPPASLSRTPRVHSRKRYSNGSHKIAAERPVSAIEKSKRDMLPAELILNFPDISSIPSEGKLNNMFRRFGPLKEFETEVDRESSRARVIFKRASDAEIAISSCEEFSIFGSTIVRYELSYNPSVSYKTDRIPASQGMETVSLPEIDFTSSAHDLGFITMQDLEDATMQDLQYPHHNDLEGVTMQDLEFPTANDIDFTGSQDMDLSIHSMDISTHQQQHEHQPTSDITLEHLELKAGETMIRDSESAPQDMEIVTTENELQANEDPIVKTAEDLKSGVQVIEAVQVQQVEVVMDPETAGSPTSLDTTGPAPMKVSTQDADTLHVQDTEVTITQDADPITNGGENLMKDHESVRAELLLKDKGSTVKCTNLDMTGLQEPEAGTDDPMILSDQKVEQGVNIENQPILSIQNADQETNQKDDYVANQESQVPPRNDDPVEVETLAPDAEKQQDPVEVDASESVVSVIDKDASNETLGGISAAETETKVTAYGTQNSDDTEVTDNGIMNTNDTEATANEIRNTEGDVVPASEIENTGNDARVIAEDSELETTKLDVKQVAQDYPKEASDAELTHDDNVEIDEHQELEPQIQDSSVTGNVEAEGRTSEQKDVEDGVTTGEADKNDLKMQDCGKEEKQVAAKEPHEAT